MRDILLPLFLLAALLLASCEKEETIEIPAQEEFCPIHFMLWSETFNPVGCIWDPQRGNPDFFKQDGKLVLRYGLASYDQAYIAREKNYKIFNLYQRAYDLSAELSTHDFHFEKLSMDIGTRVSLYLGPTSLPYWSEDSTFLIMGTTPFSQNAGPSDQQPWQVYVQRELDGTYTLGCMADGENVALHTGIADFKGASFFISNAVGRSLLSANLFQDDPQNSIVLINTSNLTLPKMPDNLFAAFGFNIIGPLQNDCETRFVSIKLNRYSYTNNRPNEQLFDFFECNTIVK